MFNIKNLDPNNIKIDEKSYKNILIYYIGYVTPNVVNPLYLIINNANRYIEESNRNNYVKVVPTDESRYKLKEYDKYGSYYILLVNNK